MVTLVFGGTGKVGSVAVRHLVEKDRTVAFLLTPRINSRRYRLALRPPPETWTNRKPFRPPLRVLRR